MLNANVNLSKDTVKIPKWAHHLLSTDDLLSIEKAVRNAEKTTIGEIVPIIVRSSTSTATLRRLLFMILVLVFLCILLFCFSNYNSLFAVIFEICGAVSIYLVSFIFPLPNWIVRILTSEVDLKHSVDLRAELEFHRSHLRSTKAKTGIQLFVSTAEHRAVVLADEAISSLLPPDTWDAVLNLLLHGLKNKNTADGFVKAIEKCGEILSSHFPTNSLDTDELCNKMIIKD